MELKRALMSLNEKIQDALLPDGMVFQAASHHGGVWERLIKYGRCRTVLSANRPSTMR